MRVAQFFACVTGHHDLRLVAVAALLCLMAMATALSFAWRTRQLTGRLRLWWLLAAGGVGGGGIWATHFVATLAFEPGLPVGFEPLATMLSFLLAVLVGAGTLALTLRHPTLWGLLVSGGLFGAGLVAMHQLGITGLQLQARLHVDAGSMAWAVLAASMLGSFGLYCGLRRPGRTWLMLGALLLTGAVCLGHLTAISGLEVLPDAAVPAPEIMFARPWLAAGIALAGMLILGFGLFGSIMDERLAQLRRDQAARLQTLVNATIEALAIHVDGRIVDANGQLGQLVGRPIDQLIGQNVLDLLAPDDRAGAEEHVGSQAPAHYEATLHHADGHGVPVEIFGRPIEYFGRAGRVMAIRDISERRRAERQLRHVKDHDGLTGLPNRLLFLDRLGLAMARARRHHEAVAVIVLDVHRFREINELYGHVAGDALLRELARRLQSVTRAMDTAARLASDQFGVIQLGAPQPEAVGELARRLLAALTGQADVESQPVEVAINLGIAVFPGEADDIETLLQHADLALVQAKAAGKNTFRMFESSMDSRLRVRRALEQDLRRAIAEGALELHYQPQLETTTGALAGFEALVRWRHPERGMIPPSEFIPLAEADGLILPLGAWVLRTACAAAADWPTTVRLGVNLSPVQFQEGDIVAVVAEVLEATGLPAHRLELEITETVLIADQQRAQAVLEAIKALGVRLALDDFGTGYSSLSHLRAFPFNTIKIDRSFVQNLASPDAGAIVQAVIGLGQSLGVTVIAEGVETEAELAFLRAAGCHEVQGYLLGRPMPADQMRSLVEATAHGSHADGRAAPAA